METSEKVAGYTAQTAERVALVNKLKEIEERILRGLDEMSMSSAIDQRWLAIGRMNLEQAFMALNRSVFQPQRVALPGDPPPPEPQEVAPSLPAIPPATEEPTPAPDGEAPPVTH